MRSFLFLIILVAFLGLNLSAHTYYIDDDGSGDGSSWDEAAWSFEELLNNWTLEDGDIVLFADGTYDEGSIIMPSNLLYNRIVVENNITLRSVNGPEVTIIQGAEATGGGCGDDAIRSVYMSAGVFEGFTIRNGYTLSYGADNAQIGGGIYANGDENSIEITNCIIEDNMGYKAGGGIYAEGNVTIHDCTIRNNTQISPTGSGGGGLVLVNGPTMYLCEISANTIYASSGGGGGIYMSSYDSDNPTIIYDCLIEGNAASHSGGLGGGVSAHTSGATSITIIENCTIVNNTVNDGYGGGVLLARGGTSDPKLQNSIVWGNSGASTTFGICNDISPVSFFGGVVQYTCASDGVTNGVEGNTTSDPLFVDAASDDYALQETSPCVNAGNNDYVCGTTDLAGNDRILEETVDMGAYEYLASTYSLWVGSEDTDWNNGSNWETGIVPTSTDDVIIPSDCFYYPAIEANVSCQNITIENGGSVQINLTYSLNVSGDFTLEDGGSFMNNGTLQFSGSDCHLTDNRTTKTNLGDILLD